MWNILSEILSWTKSALKFGLGLCKSGAFWISVVVASAVSAFAFACYKVGSQSLFVTRLLFSAEEHIRSMIAFLCQTEVFKFIYHTLALDVFFQSFFSVFSFFIVFAAFIVVDMVIAGVITTSIFLSWRVQAKILAAFTGGEIKT